MFLSRRPERIDWLKKVPLFSGLSGRDLDLIARQTDVVKADAGKALTRQGELGIHSYLAYLRDRLGAAWSALYSTRSYPFERPETGKIAVKVINHYGDEVLKVYEV